MKNLQMIITGIVMTGVFSCNKLDLLKDIHQDIVNGYDMPNSSCLMTHSDEDFLYYSLDIFYNDAGDPDSMISDGSFPSTLEYDDMDRLQQYNAGTEGVHFEYIYTDDTFLPAALNYYRPDLGGLIAVYEFEYNIKGEMIRIDETNILYPAYDNVQKLYYNSSGNLTKRTSMLLSDSMTTTSFEATLYDDKPNFFATNQWIKYTQFASEIAYFQDLLYSANNAINWSVSDGLDFTSSFEYNAEGFATKVYLHCTAGAELVGDFTRTSAFNCE